MGLKDASVFGNKKKKGLPRTDLTSTRWSEAAKQGLTLKEYPRPSMVRSEWINLNGWWEYAFVPVSEKVSPAESDSGTSNSYALHPGIPADVKMPSQFDGTILVPFSPESQLSSVHRQLQPDEYLWYRRKVEVPVLKEGYHYLLHFGAVDQSCRVFVDGLPVGSHEGGYLPFTIDLGDVSHFVLSLCVRDVSDTSYHSRGKQKLNRGGMFYTAQSGIWQTVWMEAVPDCYISSVKITPDIDKSCVFVRTMLRSTTAGIVSDTGDIKSEKQNVIYRFDGKTYLGKAGNTVKIPVADAHLWSPEDPFLYDLTVESGETIETLETEKTGETRDSVASAFKCADRVATYFAMRKFSILKDKKDLPRFALNNKIYLQTGVLDQGYWCDGLYTAPSDEALIYDIQTMKDLGFNMIRKHIKIEPDRWYYHCDRLGMIVWQDMVNGGSSYKSWFVTYLATVLNSFHISVHDGFSMHKLLSRTSKEGRKEYYREVKATIAALYNHPCIALWVPFNEGWGQFDAKNAARLVRKLDPTRLIDHASGWFDQKVGDVASLHHYFFKLRYKAEDKRVLALTEYGGYTWQIPGHSFSKELYGYGGYDSKETLSRALDQLFEREIGATVPDGISGFVYTQLSDVEEEANGLLTYDREMIKIDPEVVRKWNSFVVCWRQNENI